MHISKILLLKTQVFIEQESYCNKFGVHGAERSLLW